MPLAPSTRLGPYQIVAPIGAGAMGEVYRARDPRLDREVALKILSSAASDASSRRRFQDEARAASALNHPNILTVHDVGAQDNTSYIVSELIYGEPLRSLIRRGPLALPKLLDIAVQIADGLAAAHHAGIVHRDLKPENIMLTAEGRVKILDFGLAKPTEEPRGNFDETIDPNTQPGMIMGTVSYMSPEQARGGVVDFRSDQFSLGAILFEMLTGERAFQRDSAIETLLAITTEEPPRVETAPAPLRWVIERCLAKSPAQRYGDTIDLYRDLRAIRDNLSEALPLKVVRPPFNERLTAVEIAVLVLAALVTGFLAARSMVRPETFAGVVDRYTPFAAEEGLEAFAAWSPDSKTIAYSAEIAGIFQVFTKPAGEGGAAAQITKGDAHALFPFWTPDGRSLYFIRSTETQSGLWRVGAAGGAPELVLGNVAQAALAPDGKAMAMLRGDAEGHSLWFARLPGTRPERYTRLKPVGRWSWLAWTPGGEHLGLWAQTAEGVSEFWLVPAGGGNPSRELREVAGPVARRFAFASDDEVVFSQGDHLWRVAFGDEPVRLTAGAAREQFPAIAPSGDQLAFAAVRLAYHRVAISDRVSSQSTRELEMRWSPKGDQYAYVPRDGTPEIWLRDLSSDWRRPLVTASAFEDETWWIGDLEFSPDGQRLAYTRMSANGAAVWVSPLAGGVPVKAVNGARQPSFSPDGATLAYAYGRTGIAKGEPPKALTRDAGTQPRWSPRGKSIAYVAETGIRLVDAESGRARDLAPGYWLAIRWNPKGGAVVGLRSSGRLQVVEVSTSGRERVMADLGAAPAGLIFGRAAGFEPVRGFGWDRDGERLLLSLLHPESDLWLLAGFQRRGGFLERLVRE